MWNAQRRMKGQYNGIRLIVHDRHPTWRYAASSLGRYKLIDGVQTICIIQRKTKRPATIPLNDMALSFLPPREDDNPESLVFHLVKKSDNISKYVRRIKDKAGIEKDFTYHSSRHTTATLAISAGADISSVKEVLGHSSVTSTEVYAKVNLERRLRQSVCLMVSFNEVATQAKGGVFLPSVCENKRP